ncbi:MAG: RecQ family ATP-dependent DNA helicase [Lacibacter sp.]
MSKIHSILKQYWGYDSFRPMQEEIIASVLTKRDTLALLPTGGGKSICFQVPALAMEGLCLVVSPLIALMKDQVETLRKKGITSFAITSAQSRKEAEQILRTAGNSNCKFLYVSPERLHTSLFREYLPGLGITLVAIDEAHCISQWGYDFRPSYRNIAQLREDLPGVPMIAVTASATPEVQEDICTQLHFRNQAVFKGSFLRSNLSFSVFKVASKINKIVQILNNVPGTALIYCKSRRMTQEIAQLLTMQGCSADFYHAGLSSELRNEKQENWIKNKTRIIVCTNAFGMGIDKPDVRLVIHHDVPDCLEYYYQEAGRAGRDGKKAYAVLLYEEKDLRELQESSSIRFPTIEEVKQVYRLLVNYLQLPAGSGSGIWMEFELNDFIKKTGIPIHTAVYALKMLEQEGWLLYAEQIFIPAKLVFTASRETLESFEQAQPELEPIIKTLLRTYGGIFDLETIISEKQIAWNLKQPVTAIQEALLELHRRGLVAYTPQKEKPQLQFLHDRPPVDQLFIDPTNRTKRKEAFEQRLQFMIRYVQDPNKCRAAQIGTYFGDNSTVDCGICDTCLEKKYKKLTPEEFDRIHEMLLQKATEHPLHLKTFLNTCGSIYRQKIMQVINHLSAEEKIQVTDEGILQFRSRNN